MLNFSGCFDSPPQFHLLTAVMNSSRWYKEQQSIVSSLELRQEERKNIRTILYVIFSLCYF